MNRLKVTSEWFKWFNENDISGITTIDNKELFEFQLEGKIRNKQKDYNIIFYMIDILKKNFKFIDINEIRLEHANFIQTTNMQFFNKGDDYSKWKNMVLDTCNETISNVDPHEDGTYIYYNYYLEVDKQAEELFTFSSYFNDTIMINLWDFEEEFLEYEINLEMRKILFYKDSYFDFNLPGEILEYNQLILSNAIANFKYSLEKLT